MVVPRVSNRLAACWDERNYGFYYKGYIGVLEGLYGDNGKQNGNYCLGFPKIEGTFFGGPRKSKDHRILGSVLGSPYLGNYLRSCV